MKTIEMMTSNPQATGPDDILAQAADRLRAGNLGMSPADDFTFVRQGLKTLLGAGADTGHPAAEPAGKLLPAGVIMAIAISMVNGLETPGQISERIPGVQPLGRPAWHNTRFRPALVRRRTDILTPREAEVLQLISRGGANKQIAAKLLISIKTVEKHRQHLMEKLKIHHVAGLTRYAIAESIIKALCDCGCDPARCLPAVPAR